MGNKFASPKRAIAICDRCGLRYKLVQLKRQPVKQEAINLLVCPSCLDQPNPQLLLGMVPVNDPQALRNPRPDTTYEVSGNLHGGSRIFQWGWSPVGGGELFDLTPNNLHLKLNINPVTVTVE